MLPVGVAKHQDFKSFEKEPPNDTDVEAALEKLKNNDASLKELNLNNIKVSNSFLRQTQCRTWC